MIKRGAANASPECVLLGKQCSLSTKTVIKREGANASPECVLLGRQCSLSTRRVNKRVRANASSESVLLGWQCSLSTRTVIKRRGANASSESGDLSSHDRGHTSPDPHKFGPPKLGDGHKFDGEYSGITWTRGTLYGKNHESSTKKIHMITDYAQ